MKNYYEILGIENFATDGEIKKSFRQLAIKYHPDKNKGRKDFEEKFKEIANAYEVLTDPIKKGNFDFRLSQRDLDSKQAEPTTRTNYSEQKRPTKTENKKEEGAKIPIFWIIAIVVFILYLISTSNSDNKTTTGNTKADKELEKKENAKKPKTGEIDFKK